MESDKSGFPTWIELMEFGTIPCKKKVPNFSVFLIQTGVRKKKFSGS